MPSTILQKAKMELWTNINFAPEFETVKKNMKNKSHLYTYMESGGFGYKNAWLSSTNGFSSSIQALLEYIKASFPLFIPNGCMITAHFPASQQVVEIYEHCYNNFNSWYKIMKIMFKQLWNYIKITTLIWVH